MLKLDIQMFGGRGATSESVRNTWNNKYINRIANVMSKLGVTQSEYENNKSVGNRLYMSVIGEISDKYKQETGLTSFGQTQEFERYVKNYDIANYVKNDEISKEYLDRLKKKRR